MTTETPSDDGRAPSAEGRRRRGAAKAIATLTAGVLASLIANQIGTLEDARALVSDAVARVPWRAAVPLGWAAWIIRQHLRLQSGRMAPSLNRRPLFRGWMGLQVAGALAAADLGGRWGVWAFMLNGFVSGLAALGVVGALAAPTATKGDTSATIEGYLRHPPGAANGGINPMATAGAAVAACLMAASLAAAIVVGVGEATPWAGSPEPRSRPTAQQEVEPASAEDQPSPNGSSPARPAEETADVPVAEPAEAVDAVAALTG